MDFNFSEFLIKAHKANASDLHFREGKAPSLRIDGKILRTAMPPLDEQDFQNILLKIAKKDILEKIKVSNNVDFTYEVPEFSRYRVNYCKDLGYNITIYADDIVISGNIINPPEVISNVQKTLQKAGLVLNYKKLRIYGSKKRIMNIHIDKNGKCSIDNRLRKSIVVLQNKKDLSPKEMQTLQGMLNYKKYIEE